MRYPVSDETKEQVNTHINTIEQVTTNYVDHEVLDLSSRSNLDPSLLKNYREAIPFSENWLRQKKNQMYLHSCQPSLWRKKALIENLQKDEDAWQWEMTYVNNEWDYLINKDIDIIDIGRTNSNVWAEVTNERIEKGLE